MRDGHVMNMANVRSKQMPTLKKLSVKMVGLPQTTIVIVQTDFPGNIVNLLYALLIV